MLIKLAAANCPHSGSRPNHGVALPIHLECWPSERLTCSACTEISSVSRNCHGGPSRPSSIARAINSHQTSKDLGIVIEELISQAQRLSADYWGAQQCDQRSSWKRSQGWWSKTFPPTSMTWGPETKSPKPPKRRLMAVEGTKYVSLKPCTNTWNDMLLSIWVFKKNHDENLWVWP